MNNLELNNKIINLLDNKNIIDLLEQAISFEKEYKTTDFYKNTKINLIDLIKYAKMFYMFDLDKIFQQIQKHINELNLDNLTQVLDQISEVFGAENAEISQILKEVSKL